MAAIVVNGWKVSSFIGDKPTEEYTKEELKIFFKKALDEAFLSIGYVPAEKKDAADIFTKDNDNEVGEEKNARN